MAKRRGGAAARQRMAQLPEKIIEQLLPGAARAGADVIAEDAKDRLGSKKADSGGREVLIAEAVKVRVKRDGTKVRARILLEGPGAYVGRWLEYGTAPHFISVDDEVRQGMTARRINTRLAAGDDDLKATLLINGKPVGRSVFHPGAKPEPFLGPALATREADATAAALAHVLKVATRKGLVPKLEGDA